MDGDTSALETVIKENGMETSMKWFMDFCGGMIGEHPAWMKASQETIDQTMAFLRFGYMCGVNETLREKVSDRKVVATLLRKGFGDANLKVVKGDVPKQSGPDKEH